MNTLLVTTGATLIGLRFGLRLSWQKSLAFSAASAGLLLYLQNSRSATDATFKYSPPGTGTAAPDAFAAASPGSELPPGVLS